MENIYTEDIADFGARERAIAAELLALPFPEGFYDSKTRLAFNRNSGFVFLINEDYQCAIINPDSGKLELFHSTPHHGKEGFLSDLLEELPGTYHPEDADYIRQCAKNEHIDLPEAWRA